MCALEVEIMWTGRVQRSYAYKNKDVERLKEQCRFSISTHNHKKSKHSTLRNQIITIK